MSDMAQGTIGQTVSCITRLFYIPLTKLGEAVVCGLGVLFVHK